MVKRFPMNKIHTESPAWSFFTWGCSLLASARQAVQAARKEAKGPVLFEFCGIQLVVGPHSKPAAIVRRYRSAQQRSLARFRLACR